MTKKKLNEKEEKKKKHSLRLESNSGPCMYQAVLLPPRHMETYYEGHDNVLFRAFPLEFCHGALCKVDRAKFNTNSKIFLRRMTAGGGKSHNG